MATKYRTWNGDVDHETVAAAVRALSSAKDYVYATDNNVPRALNKEELEEEFDAKLATV